VTERTDHNKKLGANENTQSLPINMDWEIHPSEVKRLLDSGNLVLVDVRTPAEWEAVRIAGAVLIPLAELASRIGELDPNPEIAIVIHCHHGMRSLRAVQWLRQQGFRHAKSMAAGIDGWSVWVDPSLPRY